MTERGSDLARLWASHSRTFGVCVVCPHGSHLPGFGTRATAWYYDPKELGRYGLCAEHDRSMVAGGG